MQGAVASETERGPCCRVTEADVRLYPTLIRFDSIYATLFKCSKRRIADYPELKAWLRRMYNLRVSSAGQHAGKLLACRHSCFQNLACKRCGPR